MGNRVSFQLTKFTNIDETLNEDSVSYGYRVYDDYGQTYSNVMSEEEIESFTPNKALDVICQLEGDFWISIEGKEGFYYNDQWISKEEYPEVFDKIQE